ncbi:MAG: hypothetical protein Q4G50_08890 [Corynebacterium sp.]|uniref:hypothetical protein n=1 Tax=Corynebacterium sp. TaxID=1720 RepID=UPI0026DEE019|nr:hypothetical protein [Corynebacterium sp.]MDO5670105.1 hypothetical protein [Corynebacterium sp.]
MSRISQATYAMLVLTRQDARDLQHEERTAELRDPDTYQDWVTEFTDNPTLLRQAPPAEVAALIRSVDAHPDWLDDPPLLAKLHTTIDQQLSTLDTETVLGDSPHAVDAVRQAQRPLVVRLRTSLLVALDHAVRDVDEQGVDLVEALATRLAQRGLTTPAPTRQETPAISMARKPDRMQLTLGASRLGRGVGR